MPKTVNTIENVARCMVDALGLDVDPAQLVTYIKRANRAYSIGNMDDYHNQCNYISALVRGESHVIDKFIGAFAFLSNFYPCRVVFGGEVYPSVEHAYQAAKTMNLEERKAIQNQDNPAYAKRLGKKVTLRPDWETIKVGVMLDLLKQKFTQEPLHTMLVQTDKAELIEGNNWGDKFWGQVDGVGQNVLGKLLMQIRDN